AESILAVLPALDGHGELDLLLLGQQRLASRRLQVEAKVVSVVGPQGTRRLRHGYHSPPRGPVVAAGRGAVGPRELGSFLRATGGWARTDTCPGRRSWSS